MNTDLNYLKERFFKKVKKTETCWIWIGAKTIKGYGIFCLNGTNTTAHRAIYQIENGIIKDKSLEVDHLCKNIKCVNPNHLELVTKKENLKRGETLSTINSRKVLCPKGHEYTQYSNFRRCKICHNEISKKSYRQNREKILASRYANKISPSTC